MAGIILDARLWRSKCSTIREFVFRPSEVHTNIQDFCRRRGTAPAQNRGGYSSPTTEVLNFRKRADGVSRGGATEPGVSAAGRPAPG